MIWASLEKVTLELKVQLKPKVLCDNLSLQLISTVVLRHLPWPPSTNWLSTSIFNSLLYGIGGGIHMG